MYYCVCTATTSSDSLCHGSTRTQPGKIGEVRSIGGRFRANGPVSQLLRHVRHLGIGAGAGNENDEERHPNRPRRHVQGRPTYLTEVPGLDSAAVEQTPEWKMQWGAPARIGGALALWGPGKLGLWRWDWARCPTRRARREKYRRNYRRRSLSRACSSSKERSNQHQRRRAV